MEFSPVLIITHREAREVDGVIDALRSDGCSVTRWNLCQYPEHSAFSVRSGGSRNSNWPTDISDTQFAAAWLHDVGSFSVAASLTGLEREVALRESSAFWEGALDQLSCDWINTPTAIRRASNKLRQLKTAERLGIPVPDYMVSNDPAALAGFAAVHDSVIVKALASGYLEYGELRAKVYTRRLHDANDTVLDGVAHGPVILQREIRKSFELRVTIVDGECFTTSADCSALPGNVVDIRQLDFHTNRWRYSRASNASQVEEWSLLLISELGLSYGGLDWVLDDQMRPFFLECNPLGSFKWYEMTGGFPITQAIARGLERRSKSRSEQRIS